MAEMRLPEDLDKLWQKIEQQHLVYLESTEHRDEHRGRLENYMRQYLHMAPHEMKFNCAQTVEVLRRSVESRDFSGNRAARAWVALAKYAENIIRQPWRPEFREIKVGTNNNSSAESSGHSCVCCLHGSLLGQV